MAVYESVYSCERYMDHPSFRAGLNMEKAEEMLYGHPKGTFLLRNSNMGYHYCVISVVTDNGFAHYRIEIKRDLGYQVPDYVGRDGVCRTTGVMKRFQEVIDYYHSYGRITVWL